MTWASAALLVSVVRAVEGLECGNEQKVSYPRLFMSIPKSQSGVASGTYLIFMEPLKGFICKQCLLFPSHLPTPAVNHNDVRRLVEIAYQSYLLDESIEIDDFVEGFKQSPRHSDISEEIICQAAKDYCDKANEFKEIMSIMKQYEMKL